MRKIDSSFKGFYPNEEYWVRLDKCVENFDELVPQVPKAISKKIDPDYSNDEYIVEISDEEDQSEDDQPGQDVPESSAWAEQRHKK